MYKLTLIYFLFVTPLIWSLAFLQHYVMLEIPFHIKFYIVPTIASIFISLLISKLRIIQNEKDQKELEKQIFKIQKFHIMTLFTNEFVHEFKNILLGLNINTENFDITFENKTNNQITFFEKQERYLTRAKNLLDQISLFSGKESDEVCDINLKDIFIDIERIINTFTKKKVSIEIKINNYKIIRGIRSQIYQTFLNLCFNSSLAIKNLKNPKMEISISCSEDKPDNIQINIIDTRSSFSLSEINSELKNSKFSNFSDMGLNYCFRVIQNHKGKIEASRNNLDQFQFITLIPFDFENQNDH